jgi:hypothetical protein
MSFTIRRLSTWNFRTGSRKPRRTRLLRLTFLTRIPLLEKVPCAYPQSYALSASLDDDAVLEIVKKAFRSERGCASNDLVHILNSHLPAHLIHRPPGVNLFSNLSKHKSADPLWIYHSHRHFIHGRLYLEPAHPFCKILARPLNIYLAAIDKR